MSPLDRLQRPVFQRRLGTNLYVQEISRQANVGLGSVTEKLAPSVLKKLHYGFCTYMYIYINVHMYIVH
jgi:hypothetical protein